MYPEHCFLLKNPKRPQGVPQICRLRVLVYRILLPLLCRDLQGCACQKGRRRRGCVLNMLHGVVVRKLIQISLRSDEWIAWWLGRPPTSVRLELQEGPRGGAHGWLWRFLQPSPFLCIFAGFLNNYSTESLIVSGYPQLWKLEFLHIISRFSMHHISSRHNIQKAQIYR